MLSHTFHPMRRLCRILLATALLMGCTHSVRQDNRAGCTPFTDDYGRLVQVPDQPTRIVSTSPAVTQILYALGAQDLLVGRTDFCTYPAEAKSIESIGGISNLNVEKILSLSPDLVISGSMIPKKSTLLMEKLGVPTCCVIEQQHFEGLYDNISKIGRLTGRTHSADSLNNLIKTQFSLICRKAPAHPKSVYYVVGFGPSGNFTAGGKSFINDIITLAGGRNIAEDIEGWNYSLETLLDKDPEYIIIRQADSATFCRTAPYNRLSAVKNGHVIGIESGIIDLQVPRNIDAIRLISDRLRSTTSAR